MLNLGFAVAALALASAVSGKATKPYRQTCVDATGQVKTEGAVWYEGVSNCLKLTCTNGVAVGNDNCKCLFPDQTTGSSGDVWYSVPTCQSCKCTTGNLKCDTLLNCLLPSTAAATTIPATVTVTAGILYPTASAGIIYPSTSVGLTCSGPDDLVMQLGEMYIEGCRNCTCTIYGLNCYGMVECPYVNAATNLGGSCFIDWTAQAALVGTGSYVPAGYTFQEECNTCTCVNSIFNCVYDTTRCTPQTTSAMSMVTVTVTPTDIDTNDLEDFADMENANRDCDINNGIVLEGDLYVNDCGASCTCVNGNMNCGECPDAVSTGNVNPTDIDDIDRPYNDTDTADVSSGNTSEYVCIATDGKEIENGESYKVHECTTCTCRDGIFNCVQTCERDCTTTAGKVIQHGKSTTSTCSKCKCNDATLICDNTCAGQVCKVPNSNVTIAQGCSKTIDGCINCKCSSSALLSCRDNCPKKTDCVCNGSVLSSGKTDTTNCNQCACNSGSLSCKTVC